MYVIVCMYVCYDFSFLFRNDMNVNRGKDTNSNVTNVLVLRKMKIGIGKHE